MMKNVFRIGRELMAVALVLSLLTSFGNSTPVSATNIMDATYQTLPFSQDWTNINLITTSDDWTGVPGIVGYRGDGLTGSTGVDPQTVLADGSATPFDVNANLTDPDTFFTGGVAEFEITNPVVALNGSGTADAPFIVVYLNTTGYKDITVAYNVRDLDGTTDNAIQQVALHYRVGASGDYTNVPAAYIADATTGPSTATLVTAVNVILPLAVENQAQVELRIMTTNALGNDEWVGIDDISITGTLMAPEIALTKTVGTDPTSCATTAEITLPAGGGEVTYCYEVENTGNVTLNLHDLYDNQLGSMFDSLSYALAPGASAFITESATINVTTVNTAIWTAYNVGPTDVVTATDVATVTVEVANPSIVLNKTVGTDPNSCATTAEITLPAGGGEVTYCYEVENTGNVTLNLHDLYDNQLGSMFDSLSYALAPGASAFITESATINVTTVNTAIWTAYNIGPTDAVTATDVATVTVETPAGVCPVGPEVGALTTSDPTFNRPVGFGGSCNLSGVGTAVYYDVYSYNLGGLPPHDLFASLIGGTTMDTVLVFYQAPDGSPNPFDPTQGCLNTVAYNDDFSGDLQSQISATGLGAGWIDVVVTTYENDVTGAYNMAVASESCQGVSIALTKTVGTEAGVCATTDDITVAEGTTVYYCYEVTNTGDETLNLHDLVDDQLGTIFSGLNYPLTPGSSVNTVAAGLSIPAVMNVTTVNTATWTAYNTDGPSVTATDVATVTVETLAASIALTKTVGTVPGVCATTDDITVMEGTEVYYCYQIQNTGNVTFTLHDLVDTELGAILTALPYSLAPGAFSPQVIVPATLSATTVNTATWTAYVVGGPSATATDMARVVVEPSAVSVSGLRASAAGGWSSIALLGALALGGFAWRRKRR